MVKCNTKVLETLLRNKAFHFQNHHQAVETIQNNHLGCNKNIFIFIKFNYK